MFLLNWFSRFQSFKQRRFGATHVNRKWLFSFSNDGVVFIFSQIVSIRVKKLCNTNFISSRHIKRENALLPVDVLRSKTPLLKLPCSLRSIAVLVGRANKPRRTRAVKPRPTKRRGAMLHRLFREWRRSDCSNTVVQRGAKCHIAVSPPSFFSFVHFSPWVNAWNQLRLV